jgi:hypothetical protein
MIIRRVRGQSMGSKTVEKSSAAAKRYEELRIRNAKRGTPLSERPKDNDAGKKPAAATEG